MDEEASFLTAIRRTPADNTARLVYADWLDERDNPESRDKSDFLRLELRMAESPERGLNRVRWLHKLQKLAATLDPGWLAVVSHPKLEACRVSFRFECPKRWDRLEPTGADRLRFCTACEKHVHYCETIGEARAHAARGDCVAVSLALVRRADDLFPPRPVGPGLVVGALPITPEMIAPPRAPGHTAADPPLDPDPPQEARNRREWIPEVQPKRRGRPRRKRSKKKEWRNRNIQREDWEDSE